MQRELEIGWIDNNKSIVIVGGSNSGKTNLAFYLASKCSHKTKYTLGYPVEVKGFTKLSDKADLFRLKNCVVIIDEFGRYFERYDRHHNDALHEALDFCEHRNIKLILTAQNNQAIDRNLESKIKCWCLKKLNVHTLKQGGMCKIAIETTKDFRITSSFLALEVNEFIWWGIENGIAENGIWAFPDMGIKKDWLVERNVTTTKRNVERLA